MKLFDELTLRQISANLAISLSTVSADYVKAIQRLRTELVNSLY
jgi:DNA-directed RNA polymerase specialized sigma subunit